MEVDSINSNYIPPAPQPAQTTQPVETTSNESSAPPVDQNIASRVDLII